MISDWDYTRVKKVCDDRSEAHYNDCTVWTTVDQCTVRRSHEKMQYLSCILHFVVGSVHCTIRNVPYTLWYVHCIFPTEDFATFTVQCSAVWSAVCSAQCAVRSVQCAVWCVQCAVCSMQCEVFSMQCAGYCVGISIQAAKCSNISPANL